MNSRGRALWISAALVALGGACGNGSYRDAEINSRVEARLRDEPNAANVTVTSSNRIVRLDGVVNTEADRAAIEDRVRRTEGVLAIDDRLVVQPAPTLTAASVDLELARTLGAKLTDAGFDRVRVDVDGDTVRLSGDVDKARHEQALQIVRSATSNRRLTIIDDATEIQ